ncbi:MAG TPA: hypothetical protein DCM86_07355 [Verrucomicrobiales bacterium]|nr:hypothetical protein [Verrucomicrobiales bacterium]
MAQREPSEPAARRWLLLGSALLNLALAGWLAWTEIPRLSGAPRGRRGLDRAAEERVSRADALPAPRTADPGSPIDWSTIESSDYREYIANLRAVGCPESLIRDVIGADLTQEFVLRARQIWTPVRREYWQKPRSGGGPNADQLARLQALAREQGEVMRSLLGVTLPQQELIDVVLLQLWGPARQLASLGEEKRRAALEALAASGYFEELEASSLHLAGSGGADREAELERKQLKVLETILSPEEMKEFRYRNLAAASRTRQSMGRFEATESEFQALMKIEERLAADPKTPGDFYLRKAAEVQAARQALGEKRAAEFEQASDLFYVWSSRAVERFGLPDQAAALAWQAKRDAMAAADAIRRDGTVGAPERARQLAEVQRRATARIEEVLGAEAARFARAGDGVWLQVLAGGGSAP